MQYKVPQNIDLEDRIVGPFTMRQFIYILVGGAIIYGWWNFANSYEQPPPMAIFMPLALPVGLLTFCFALVKINDRPFEAFCLSLIRFLFAPKKRMWQEGYVGENVILLDKTEQLKDDQVDPKKTVSLDDLSKNLEQQASKISQPKPADKPTGATTAKPVGVNPEAPTSSGAPTGINLSVKDVKAAAEKQSEAQKTPDAVGKKGFLGIFK